jgi:hypothetical protein
MRDITNTFGLLGLAVVTAGCLTVSAAQFDNRSSANVRMTGTYELQRSRGDDPQRTAEAATRSLPVGQRARAYQTLLSRLDPPLWLSIDRDGRHVAVASSRGPRSEFDADGESHRERGLEGRMLTTRAEINDNRLRISSTGGSRGSDFTVTFESMDNGSALRVTRRLDDDDLTRPVTIESYYRRSEAQPRWDIYEPERERDREFDLTSGFGMSNSVGPVPHGTRLLATLDTPLSMRTSRTGEPFTMTVRSPEEFRGARIDGFITRIDARRASGDGADMRMDFRTIELRGRSSDFDADLDTVRLADGSVLRVGADGDARDRDDDRGETTVRNGAIGATIGAIIGAVAGGGKGAVVGAVVGGAGGVILSQGNEQLDLPRGADVSLTVVSRSDRASR